MEGPRSSTVIPNRIFVGGIPESTTESDLSTLFMAFGRIKATKIILDRSGMSKGYGFVTFETEEEAQNVINNVKDLKLKDRRLNIATAVKKLNASTIMSEGNPNFPIFPGRDGVYQATYPILVQQPLYMPHYYQTAAATSGYPLQQYLLPSTEQDYFYATMQQGQSLNNGQEITDNSLEGGKTYPKHLAQSPGSEMDNRPSREIVCSSPVPSFRIPAMPQMHQYPLRQVVSPRPGMTIVAYPSSLMMGTPTIVQMREASGSEQEGTTDMSFLQSPSPITGALTPPQTPLTPIPCDFGLNSSIEEHRK